MIDEAFSYEAQKGLFMFTIIFIVFMIILFFVIRLVTNLIYKKFIPFLIQKKMGQVVRKDGMETHLKKAGTPTMGGIVFVIVFLVCSSLFCIINVLLKNVEVEEKLIPIFLFFVMSLMHTGYKDDLKKITLNNTDGLSPKAKLFFQIFSSVIFVGLVLFINNMEGVDTSLHIPFVRKIISINLQNILLLVFFVLVNVFILVGTQNGVNFTDGIDGLLVNITIVISIFYILECIILIEIGYLFVNLFMVAALSSFKKYNKYPAKIFMGDTGSLALGAYVGGMSVLLNLQMFLPIYGFVYMMEVISVILQVSYFKFTHGKRIFKMAPIHHHFEKCGWSERKVVLVFTMITIILCIITFCINLLYI